MYGIVCVCVCMCLCVSLKKLSLSKAVGRSWLTPISPNRNEHPKHHATSLFPRIRRRFQQRDEQRGNRTIAKTELNGNADYATTKIKEKRSGIHTGSVPCAPPTKAFWSGKNKSFAVPFLFCLLWRAMCFHIHRLPTWADGAVSRAIRYKMANVLSASTTIMVSHGYGYGIGLRKRCSGDLQWAFIVYRSFRTACT